MSNSDLKLLTPVNVGTIGEFKNRVVMAAMTRARTNNPEHVPNDLQVEYYKQRDSAGMILTEGTHISPGAVGWVDAPGCWTEEQAAGWKKVTDAANTPMVLQLWHQGRQSHPSLIEAEHGQVLAPSAVAVVGTECHTRDGPKPYPEPTPMTTEQIKQAVQEYGHAANLAVKQAGFAGVQIHAANGYLIDQFLQSTTNKRDDDYGGSLAKRLRFLKEVIEAVLEHVPASKVGIKLSPNGIFGAMGSPDFRDTFDAAIALVAAKKLAFIEIMDTLGFGGHEWVKDDVYTSARCIDIIKQVQGDERVTMVIANCGYDKDSAETAVKEGKTDMVSFGRPFIQNPDLPERFRAGAELNPPHEDQNTTMGFGHGATGYTDFPAMEAAK